MVFSIPIEIGFDVLNEFLKQNISYSKHEPKDESDELVIEINVQDEFVDRATGVVNKIAERFNVGRGGSSSGSASSK